MAASKYDEANKIVNIIRTVKLTKAQSFERKTKTCNKHHAGFYVNQMEHKMHMTFNSR